MKVAVVYSFKPSEWFSCTVINKNLRAAYEGEYDDILYIDYTRDRKVSDEDLDKLIKSDIKKIIFIDHKPTPVDFLIKLKRKSEECFNRLEYTIHVFGDFPLYMPEWRTVFELLEDKSVKFIAASIRQKYFVEKFLTQKDIIFKCPFPVNPKEFFFDYELREKTRQEFEIGNEKVYLYTGRLTYQKRIVELIEIFCESLKTGSIPDDSKLFVVGAVDTLGMPFLGFSQLLGEYYRAIKKAQQKYSEFSKNIILTGRVENSELTKYYNMADCYLSLSTYHDEDYGMSIAEALCCGLPAILTDWAGYHSFQLPQKPEFCSLVDTTLTRGLPDFDRDQFAKFLKQSATHEFDRKEIMKLYHANFSVSCCGKLLDTLQSTSVEGFSGSTDFAKRITNEQFLRGIQLFKNENNREFIDLYFEAYDVYSS